LAPLTPPFPAIAVLVKATVLTTIATANPCRTKFIVPSVFTWKRNSSIPSWSYLGELAAKRPKPRRTSEDDALRLVSRESGESDRTF
jgi:hypothetical protein